MKRIITALVIIAFCQQLSAAILQVGPTRQYQKPSEAAKAVADGDTVEIDAGVYAKDACVWNKNNLLFRGIGGMAHLKAEGAYSQGKAIWVIQGTNTTVEYIEFSECAVPDNNGAGIRQEGAGLILRRCYFHDNENGVLAGANSESDFLFEFCEFNHNGYGDGYTHNMYIGHIRSFTLQFCYSHHANVGHNVKSRADHNYILYNRIMDEDNGNSSFLIDLPNGGYSYIIGNLLMQGARAENKTLINYGAEGLTNVFAGLYVVNNTCINRRQTGTFINIKDGTQETKIVNNLFAGVDAALKTAIVGAADTSNNIYNVNISDFLFADEPNYDYHLLKGSPAIEAAMNDPGEFNGYSLFPAFEYKHPADSSFRPSKLNLDCGAFAFIDETGIFSESSDANISAFPNPFSDKCKIECPAGASVKIFNSFGILIYSFVNASEGFVWQPDYSIPQGVYYILIDNKLSKTTRKIVYINH
ncbi:MAG: type sorting protein [Bacteroidota bacterium]|nr:type sorting protein [Bacteroidota bacterium]